MCETIELRGAEAWAAFAGENEEGLLQECESLEAAKAAAQSSGGLMIGGGAAPLFRVVLA